MLKKALTIVVLLLLLFGNLVALADFKNDKNIENVFEDDVITKNIRVALLYEQPLGSFIGTAKKVFPKIFQTPWTVGNISYKFIVTTIYDEDILNGMLTVDNFDVFVCPGGDVGDGESMVKGFYRFEKVKIWRENIAQFVKDGGGYYLCN